MSHDIGSFKKTTIMRSLALADVNMGSWHERKCKYGITNEELLYFWRLACFCAACLCEAFGIAIVERRQKGRKLEAWS